MGSLQETIKLMEKRGHHRADHHLEEKHFSENIELSLKSLNSKLGLPRMVRMTSHLNTKIRQKCVPLLLVFAIFSLNANINGTPVYKGCKG